MGVPGAAQGPAGGRRSGARPRPTLDALSPLVWQASQRDQLRRRRPGHAPPGDRHPARPARPAASSSWAPAGCATSSSRCSCCSWCTAGPTSRSASTATLPALAALARGGYVGRDDAASMAAAYRFLRTVEHLLQLRQLRRTHTLPDDPAVLRRLGRALRRAADPRRRGGPGRRRRAPTRPPSSPPRWRQHAREARRLHEKLFYRPLLEAVARLPSDAVRLTPEAARARLEALGYADPAGRAAAHRGADLRGVPPGGDPAHAAAGDARLVRRRGPAGRRAARVPPGQRRARRLAVVPAAAAGRHQGRAAGWPGCWPSSRYATDLLLRAPETVAILG